MKRAAIPLLFILVPVHGMGQDAKQEPASQVKPTSAEKAGLSGRVFAITTSGDLKVARFAKVTVLQGEAADEFKKGGFSDARKDIARARALGLSRLTIRNLELLCLRDLQSYRKRLDQVKKNGVGNVVDSETDENGEFSIDELDPGKYTVVAFGRAGANAALWMTDLVLEAGKTASIKMREPVAACLDVDGYFQ